MKSPDLPEVGSLWLHESGERRFFIDAAHDDSYGCVAVEYVEPRRKQWVTVTIADWLAWQAGAKRIDRGEA